MYLLEHLATFTVSPEMGTLGPRDGMRRLLQMEKTTGIWTQKMELRLRNQSVVIVDHENGVQRGEGEGEGRREGEGRKRRGLSRERELRREGGAGKVEEKSRRDRLRLGKGRNGRRDRRGEGKGKINAELAEGEGWAILKNHLKPVSLIPRIFFGPSKDLIILMN